MARLSRARRDKVARRAARSLSHGTRYYRSHRKRERQRKRAEAGRWRGLYSAFLDRNSDISMSLAEFKAEVRRGSPDHRAHLPSHSTNRIPRREQELRRETTNRILGIDYGPSEFDFRYGGRR